MNPKIGDTIYLEFVTSQFDTGAATDADLDPTVQVFENGSTTPIVAGVGTVIRKAGVGQEGMYSVELVLTQANGYIAGRSYNVWAYAQVNTVAGKGVIGSFILGDSVVEDALIELQSSQDSGRAIIARMAGERGVTCVGWDPIGNNIGITFSGTMDPSGEIVLLATSFKKNSQLEGLYGIQPVNGVAYLPLVTRNGMGSVSQNLSWNSPLADDESLTLMLSGLLTAGDIVITIGISNTFSYPYTITIPVPALPSVLPVYAVPSPNGILVLSGSGYRTTVAYTGPQVPTAGEVAAEVDSVLTAAHGTGTWQGNLGIVYPSGVQCNILSQVDGIPEDGVDVWVSTDAQGNNVVAGVYTTTMSGIVSCLLDPGTYYIWRRKGGVTFAQNPEQITVVPE